MSPNPNGLMVDEIVKQYGPLLGGNDLYTALGFKTYAAFYRCRINGEIGVHVFKLPGRRGWFAFTTEVAKWLKDQSLQNI